MTQTLTRLFDNRSDAESAVRDLESAGIRHDDISIIAGNGTGDGTVDSVDDDGDVSRGTTTGAALGGAGGLLAGLGLLAIPGLGPIVAAGWLVATVAGAGIGAAGGAATGGIVGALKHSGHTDEEANVYSEGVKRGGNLVSVRVDDAQASRALDILGRYNGVDAATRGADYRSSGWTGDSATGETPRVTERTSF